MVTPVTNKPIIPILSATAVSQLKGVASIDTFTFGKQNLRPAIIELFRKQGIEIKDIYLDNPARVRLMGMMPSFESLVAEGKTAEEIFSKLELYLFSFDSKTKARPLYILGDADNIRNINNASGATSAPPQATPEQAQLFRSISEKIDRLTAWKLKNYPNDNPPAEIAVEALNELKEFYKNNPNPKLIDLGIKYITDQRTQSDVWAGIMALNVIPIPENHPLLPEVGEFLVDTIKNGETWQNIIIAAKTAVNLITILPPAIKSKLILTANRILLDIWNNANQNRLLVTRSIEEAYEALNNLYFKLNTESQIVSAPAQSKPSPAAPTVEVPYATAKETDKLDLEKQFPLTIFNDKTQRREVILLSLKQVLAKLPQVVKVLEDLLTKSKDWECVIVAAETAIRLKDILSASDKLALKTAANNLLLEIAVEEVFSDDEVSPAPEKAENALSNLIEIMDK